MTIDVAKADPRDVYQVLISVVTPRPIAWVTTIDERGRVNLAPYSFFNVFGSKPPVVVFSPTPRRDSGKKDTLANIEANGEFVVNAAVERLAEQVNLSSKELPQGESEVDLLGLSTRPGALVKPPRLAESPASLECRLLQVIPIGEGPGSANLVIGQVVAIHVDDEVLDAEGRADPLKLAAIGRLGGELYCRTTDHFPLKRPG